VAPNNVLDDVVNVVLMVSTVEGPGSDQLIEFLPLGSCDGVGHGHVIRQIGR